MIYVNSIEIRKVKRWFIIEILKYKPFVLFTQEISSRFIFLCNDITLLNDSTLILKSFINGFIMY